MKLKVKVKVEVDSAVLDQFRSRWGGPWEGYFLEECMKDWLAGRLRTVPLGKE